MAFEIPSWLDENYMQRILRKVDIDESIKVSGLTAEAATAKGDNYSSDIHRLSVEYSRIENGREIQETKKLIVKYAPCDAREEIIEKGGFFKTELSVMSEVLPQMNEILEKVGVTTPLGARCYHVQYEKPTHIIVEDLRPRGFQMADRHSGLDLDHCSLAIRNLARFHAASIALKEKDPQLVTRYYKGVFHEDQVDTMREFCQLGGKALAKETAKWPDLSPRITEKLVKLSEAMFKKGCEAAFYDQDDFNVLNHGDFWVNNMLFHYDESHHPTDHIFVDFQLSHWGSPAIDLLYFFGTSPADDIRVQDRELLLQEYHKSLGSMMAELKCSTEPTSFEKLQETLKTRGFLEVIASLTILPIVILEKGEGIDFENLKKGEFDNPGYRGKSYMKIMHRLLPLYDSMGLLDV